MGIRTFALAALLVVYSFAAEASEACGPFDGLITTTPAPPPSVSAWASYQKETALAIPSTVQMVLIGDSLAEFWDNRTWFPAKVANLGVGGDRTQNVLWRLSSPDWSKIRTHKVLLILGTNNLPYDKPCAITLGLTKVVERIKELWPSAEIGLIEIPPRGPQFLYKNAERKEINASMRSVAGLTTVNVDDAITCHWSEPCLNYAPDNLHFGWPGYRLLVKAVRNKLFK